MQFGSEESCPIASGHELANGTRQTVGEKLPQRGWPQAESPHSGCLRPPAFRLLDSPPIAGRAVQSRVLADKDAKFRSTGEGRRLGQSFGLYSQGASHASEAAWPKTQLEKKDRMSSRPFEDNDLGVITESEKKLAPPAMYKVLLHNDDYTTMEFVVQVLQGVFHRSHTEATQIMLHIHRSGIGVAGVYTYEVAETKVAIVEALAKQNEYPLKCTMEEV